MELVFLTGICRTGEDRSRQLICGGAAPSLEQQLLYQMLNFIWPHIYSKDYRVSV